jgi:hypothetical protein
MFIAILFMHFGCKSENGAIRMEYSTYQILFVSESLDELKNSLKVSPSLSLERDFSGTNALVSLNGDPEWDVYESGVVMLGNERIRNGVNELKVYEFSGEFFWIHVLGVSENEIAILLTERVSEDGIIHFEFPFQEYIEIFEYEL